jgi:hypothetical protein
MNFSGSRNFLTMTKTQTLLLKALEARSGAGIKHPRYATLTCTLLIKYFQYFFLSPKNAADNEKIPQGVQTVQHVLYACPACAHVTVVCRGSLDKKGGRRCHLLLNKRWHVLSPLCCLTNLTLIIYKSFVLSLLSVIVINKESVFIVVPRVSVPFLTH